MLDVRWHYFELRRLLKNSSTSLDTTRGMIPAFFPASSPIEVEFVKREVFPPKPHRIPAHLPSLFFIFLFCATFFLARSSKDNGEREFGGIIFPPFCFCFEVAKEAFSITDVSVKKEEKRCSALWCLFLRFYSFFLFSFF